MSNRRVSLPVALTIPKASPSRLSPPSSLSPANRRSLPTSPILRRSLPSTPRTPSPRRKLLPDVDEHLPSTSSRYQYSLQTAMHNECRIEEMPDGALRSFNLEHGRVVDNGYIKTRPSIPLSRDGRATCPEVWRTPDEPSNKKHVVFRLYGAKNSGKRTMLESIEQYATKLVTRYNHNDSSPSKLIDFVLNDERAQLEVLLESTLESSPFASCLTMYGIVYNVDSRESFAMATSLLNRLLSRKIAKDQNVILIGNKVDLKRNQIVSKIEGACLAKIHNCNFIETSALLSINIAELWAILVKRLEGVETVETSSPSWMHKFVARLAHSAEQIVSKISI
ncbi:unnamed protein product [Caenorhabditis bovis]|uniref:Uncharacterized protein n=1 Tax=Caenorhabditis bovis TaxID=2654633 RepID=A0A8S1F9Q9_9PELO|nr:unnamed protein product [Caenorhabditis bovis]